MDKVISYTLLAYLFALINYTVKKYADSKYGLWWFGIWVVTDLFAFAFFQWLLLLLSGIIFIEVVT